MRRQKICFLLYILAISKTNLSRTSFQQQIDINFFKQLKITMHRLQETSRTIILQ